MSHHIGPLIGLLSVILTIGFLTLYGDGREGRRADVAMAYGLMSWMVYILWVGRFSENPPDALDEFVEHMGFQVCLAAASLLVLIGAAVPSAPLWRAVGFQALGGGALLAGWAWMDEPRWYALWQWFNLVVVSAIVVLLVRQVLADRSARTLARFGLSLVLLLSGLAGAWPLASAPWLASTGTHVFPAVLVCAWWLLSDRSGRLNAMVVESGAGTAAVSGDGTRRRIAQDMHDGVGAHLVAILSSLDTRDPGQKNLALSLEQCLLDLKMMVDNLYDEVSHPVEALAMLRYRVQPCLDRSGTHMIWDVVEHPVMDRVSPSNVVQLLKIAQEAVANVMRHAGASEIRVGFRYNDSTQCVELTVADDGCGIAVAQEACSRRGKGMTGMQHRAETMGAVLRVDSVPGRGTRVHVAVPCGSEAMLAPATGPSGVASVVRSEPEITGH